jgi:hypothetical protein
MRLLRLKTTTGDNTSQFTTNLSAPLVLNKNAKLALKSLNMNGLTLQDVEFLEDGEITVNMDTFELNDKLVVIPKGKYTKPDLVKTLTDLLNKSISVNDYNNNTIQGFEWRCGYSLDNRLFISFNRIDNYPKAPFQQTSNVTNPTAGFYRRGDESIDDNAFIISQLPTNRGNSKTTVAITGGTNTTEFLAGITLTPTTTGLTSLPITSYKFGVTTVIDGQGNNVLKVIRDGVVGVTVGSGFSPTQYDQIEFSHTGGAFRVKLYKDGTPIMLTTQIIGSIDLYTNYYTAITLRTKQSNEQYNFDNYFDSPYAALNNNKVIETVQIPDEEIKTLSLSATDVKISFSIYTSDLLGFSTDPTSQYKAAGTFTGNQTIAFSSIQDCVVEILSLSQLESYDTQVGYRRPILYIFDTLGIDTSGSAFGNVDYPIYIDIGNMDKYLVSSITVRVTSNNQTFDVSGYTSLLLLIED